MKYLSVANIIEARLKSGDYALDGVPGERRIAEELGVSHMTSRRAVQHLIAKGALPKRPVGRLSRAEARVRPRTELHIAFVAAAFDGLYPNRWLNALGSIVAARGGSVRHIGYVSEHDPVITDTLSGEFDGIFIDPPFNMSSLMIGRLAANRHRVVTLFRDHTDHGIPCVDMNAPRSMWRVAEHLKSLGHQRVDLLSTQPSGPQITQRIDGWKQCAQDFGLTTHIHEHPVDSFGFPDQQAYEVAKNLLKDRRYREVTALFCTTAGAASGVYRAAYEQKVVIGRELSVCTIDASRLAKLMTPSLTTLDEPPITTLLERGLNWIIDGGQNWHGPLKLEPEQMLLWIGESVGTAHIRTCGSDN